ncbi:DUF3597 domain-containing protein [Brevundimonas sp.]|jgi:hypothetical protein|uniref:DUF3597 domain-containing protein n=1 Tax=Brevundimonas sp. TaxID=1871086 RepID=UPI0037BF2CA6
MSILGKIFSTVWDRAKAGPGGHSRSAPAPAPAPSPLPQTTTAPVAPPAAQASPTASDWSTSPWPTLSEAELIETLDGMNAQRSERLNWQTSIVDLMKLVGLDSSLEERRELADELGYSGDKSDSAAMNIWLHRQVMDRLKSNNAQPTADLK